MKGLAHETWGHGETPVLLLHGFTGSRRSWNGVREWLEPHVQALVVDLPGHGESGAPEREGREGFLDTVSALAALVRAWGQGTVDVIGYSQGARIALALTVEHPTSVRRLVLESGSPGLAGRKARSERRLQDAQLAQSLGSDGLEAFVARWEALPLFDGLRRLPQEVQTSLRARRLAHDPMGLAAALRALGTGAQPDYWPSLPLLRCPTLLLTGAEDLKFTQLARRMAAEIPAVWRRAFEGCGHAPHLEAPEAWANEVLGFLGTPWYEAPEFEQRARSVL
ncbi:MAG: 2-succinyl-6-hydroxy-2,4-cyclohexadiene-1-carboxylate synthase [Myxococcaceae bacterium]|nr:2-succinyl-6-hydroxy-2,4-cyclohexadiene-1-carboxylate synthase [Myxococcaceae bacterium]MCI0669362.1 2-succinyl-6-hydroxy-2,4-cyclohexadiene-1-carboxylate synthase [Myxococcaceae bacterium]